MTRLTNGFSNKLDNHKAAIALHFAYYNFCTIHGQLARDSCDRSGNYEHVSDYLRTAELAFPKAVGVGACFHF